MDDETLKYLAGLKCVNNALLFGLEAAVNTMENWDDLRDSIVESIKKMVAQGKGAFDVTTAKN